MRLKCTKRAGYQENSNGLGLTESDSIDFVKFLAEEAHSHKMAIGLKNAGSIISKLVSVTDFAVNEQCVQYSDCQSSQAFIKAGKPVFHIEYPEERSWASTTSEACSASGKAKGTDRFSTVIKNMELDTKVAYCDGKTYKA